MQNTQRQSNFELLRMLAGMAVIVLHFNYFPGGGGALPDATGLRYFLLTILEILSVSAVNLFILLSGYFSCFSKTVKTGRLIELLLQTVFFNFAFRFLSCLLHRHWSVKALLGSLLPANYFVVLYVVLMLLSPFINKMIGSLKDRDFSKLMFICFFLFSVCATAVDILKSVTDRTLDGLSPVGLEGSMGGYTIVNFVLVYLIGAWLRRRKPFVRFRTGMLICSLFGTVLIILIWRQVFPDTAWTYCNPVLIAEACIIFSLFERLKINSRWINAVAPASFTCFLIHTHFLGFLMGKIRLEGSLLYVFSLLVITVIAVYGLSFVVMLGWNMTLGGFIKRASAYLPGIGLEE